MSMEKQIIEDVDLAFAETLERSNAFLCLLQTQITLGKSLRKELKVKRRSSTKMIHFFQW